MIFRYLAALLLLIISYGTVIGQRSSVPAYDPLLTDYKYPYPTQAFQFRSQGQSLQMTYMDEGDASADSQTVVLLHGKNFNGAYWQTTMALLLEQGYRVVVPDQVGFGKSSKPQAYQFTFQQLALNTKQLLDSLGIQQTMILGHSMGGMLAARFALMYPETVSDLILMNPIGLEDWKLKVPYQPVTRWYDNELKKDYASIKKYQQENYYDGQWKAAYDPWVNILAGWTQHPDYPRVAWNAALTYDMIFTQPVVYELDQLEVPTLLIIGTRDRTALGKPLVSEEVRQTMGRYDQLGKQTQQAIPQATLVELEGLGHLPHIEDFDQFRRALLGYLTEKEGP